MLDFWVISGNLSGKEEEIKATITQLINKGLLKAIDKQPLNSSTEIRLTRLCSQRCRQCSVYDKKTEPAIMSLKNFKILAERLRNYGAYIGFISGGEATLVPHLDEILIEAKRTFTSATTLVTGLYGKTDVIQRFSSVALTNEINIQTSLDGHGELGDYLRGAKNFSDTVLNHMSWISKNRKNSKSLLYANIVINNMNLEQVPELIKRAKDLGWKTTIGVYHTLTDTTRSDDEMKLHPGKRLDNLLEFLDNNVDILNLNSFITGINDFVNGKQPGFCAFIDSPVLSTRSTIMENGDVHLCHGKPIGNILENELHDIFVSDKYKKRILEYKKCKGCWTTCYSQRYLLIHPRSMKEFVNNVNKVLRLRCK